MRQLTGGRIVTAIRKLWTNVALLVRTIDGMRVALAGLPASMPVDVGLEVDLSATTVSDIRQLPSLPHLVMVEIPFPVQTDSRVTITRQL